MIDMARNPDPLIDQYLYLTNYFYRQRYFGGGEYTALNVQKPLNDIFDRYRGTSTPNQLRTKTNTFQMTPKRTPMALASREP